MFSEIGPEFNVNYQRELDREKQVLENVDKIPMTVEERPIRVFWILNEKFPDVRWVGQSINIPSKGIWVKYPWEVNNIKGPGGDEINFVREVVRETK